VRHASSVLATSSLTCAHGPAVSRWRTEVMIAS